MQQHMQALGRADEFFVRRCRHHLRGNCAGRSHHCDSGSGATGKLTVIGSSLGGFYATWLAEKYACKAVLLNPAVKPPRDLESYVGVTTYYHSDQVFEFKAEYVAQLRALAVEKITRPERYFLLAATGDEVLDWREMVAHYPGAKQKIIEGSDHGIAEFADYLGLVMAFCDDEV
jgi:predicted esterase YcpF (UPF0227 family)